MCYKHQTREHSQTPVGGGGNLKLLAVKIVLIKFLEIHYVSDVYVSAFINFYLFNFAIIIHAWQGHHNSITPITVSLLKHY